MKRNEVTTAHKLKPGDRFYKQSDKDKKVFEVAAGEADKPKAVFVREPHKKYADPLNGDTKVVFLRHGIIFN